MQNTRAVVTFGLGKKTQFVVVYVDQNEILAF